MTDYTPILLVALLPLLYKYLFWLYVIQLKEYRWDRLKEYLLTPQGKNALYNFWFLIELPLFIASLSLLFHSPLEIILYPVVFYFFLMQNIFVLGKVLRGKIFRPRITGRLLLTLTIILGGISFDMHYIFLLEYDSILLTYLLGILFFAPIVIYICIILSLPFVLIGKANTMKKANLTSRKARRTLKIGITGSYGKSSVKEFLSSILEQEGKTLKTPENQNTEMGVSNLIINKLDSTYKYFVAEMGAYKIGEIKTLGNIANHKHGILTAVGTQHIGIFGGIENTKKAKAEIAERVLKNKGNLYVNWENEHIRSIHFPEKLNVIKYGNYKNSDVKYKILHTNHEETKFVLSYKNKSHTFTANLIGTHNILNLSGVIALCLDIGIKKENIKKHLLHLSAPANTLEIKKVSHYTLINDSYNLPENGLIAGLEVLQTFKGKRVLVVDDILELGGESKAIHLQLGEKIAKNKQVDKILLVGSNYQEHFKKGLLSSGFKPTNILSSIEQIPQKSTILFEGRGSKKYFDIFSKK